MGRRQRELIKQNPKGSILAPGIGAFAGLLIGYAAASRLHLPPAAGQLPGYALENGFNPKTDVLRLAILLCASLLGGAVAGIVLRGRHALRPWRRAGGPSGENARPEAAVPGLLWPAVFAHALAVWTLLVGPLAPLGVSPGWLLVALAVLSLALATLLGGRSPKAGAPFLGAACPILALAFLGSAPASRALAAAAAGFVLPVFARIIGTRRVRLVRVLRVLTLVVLLPGSVTAMAAAAVMRSPRVANIFEDGHALLPASEYLRGELPYRDIVPGHGLVSDGLLASVQLRLFGDDIAGLKRGEKVSGVLFWPAFYAMGYAATGSPALGLGGLLFSFVAFPQYHNPRAIASLWALALAIHASRSKKRRAWLACGAALPVGLCVAVEFAFYAACGTAVALWVARGRRRLHLCWLASGAAASAAVIGLCMLAFGILGGFLRTTFVFVPSLLPVYAQGFPAFPVPHGAAQWMALPGNETALLYGFAAASLVLLGAFLPQAPRVGARARAMLPVCAWVVAAMLSVIERQHVGYALLAVPLGLLLVGRWAQGWRPWTSPRTAGVAAVPALLLWSLHPVSLLSSVAYAIAHAPVPAETVMLEQPPRARGGLFPAGDAKLVAATANMLRAGRMAQDETWLDFGNAPGLYYLFDRDCPIRYYEPGFYESESAQREVIAAVERNPRVRAALMSAGPALAFGAIDRVSNAKRAPLVDAFIRERFRPFFREGEVEFWLKKDPEAAGGASSAPTGVERRESSPASRP